MRSQNAPRYPFLVRLGLFHVNPWNLMILVVLTALVVSAISSGFIPTAADKIQSHFNITNFEIAVVGSVSTFTSTAVSIPLSYSAFIPWRLKLMCVGTALFGVCYAFFGSSSRYWMLVVASAASGVFSSTMCVYVAPLISEVCSIRRRTLLIGVYFLTLVVGAGIGFAVGGALIDSVGWRWCFWGGGFVAIIVGIAWGFLRPPKQPAHAESAPQPSGSFWAQMFRCLQHPIYALMITCKCLGNFAISGLGFWLAKFLKKTFDLTDFRAGLYVGVSVLLPALVGIILMSWFSDRLGRNAASVRKKTQSRLFLVLGCVLVMYPFAAAGFEMHQLILLLVLLGFSMVAAFGFLSPALTLTLEVIPHQDRTVAMALVYFLTNVIGQLPAPPLLGLVLDRTHNDYRFTFELTLLAAVAMFACLVGALILAFLLPDSYFPDATGARKPTLTAGPGENDQTTPYLMVLDEEEDGTGGTTL